MTTIPGCLSLLAFAALAACGKPAAPPNPLQTQREAMEKAKGVDQILQQQADDTRKKIDDAQSK